MAKNKKGETGKHSGIWVSLPSPLAFLLYGLFFFFSSLGASQLGISICNSFSSFPSLFFSLSLSFCYPQVRDCKLC